MKKILCYIYEGMADFEISLLLHRLRNTGKREIVAVSEKKEPFTAQLGLHYTADKLVAAICFAPQFLGRAGILSQYRFTTSCSAQKIRQLGVADPFYRENEVDVRCHTDRNVITAKGYAFVDFALAVCDTLQIFETKQLRYEQLERVKEL